MIPPAPPFDPSMIPPGSMQPVFPKASAADLVITTPEIEAQAVALAAVKSRAAYLAGLNQDREFHAQVLDGWMQEQEAEALQWLDTCGPADVLEGRATWKAIKDLRRQLRDELQASALKVKTESAAPRP